MSADEAIAIVQLRENRVATALRVLMGGEQFKTFVLDSCASILSSEVLTHTRSTQLINQTKPEQVRDFDITKLGEDFRSKLPACMQMIEAMTLRSVEGKVKTHASLEPAITSLMAKCLGIFSDRNSLFRYVMSTILLAGGSTQSSMDQLSKLYDCMGNTARDDKQNQFVKMFAGEFVAWRDATDARYQFAFDNVDKAVKRRYSSKAKQGKIHHMVQTMAYRDRVPPIVSCARYGAMDSACLLPDESDIAEMKEQFVIIVLSIWTKYIKSLSEHHVTGHQHQFSSIMKTKTSKVRHGLWVRKLSATVLNIS